MQENGSYVPEKDSVQETGSAFKDNHLKTLINKGTELQVPIWHSGTREAILMHVGSVPANIQYHVISNMVLSPLKLPIGPTDLS